MDINENIVIKEEELMIGFVICVWRISLVLMLSRHIKNICINNSFVMIVLWLKVSLANYAQAIKSAQFTLLEESESDYKSELFIG